MEETKTLNDLKEDMRNDMNKDIKFSLNNFLKYLENIKNYCISLKINLDRNQINTQITDILNDILLNDIKDEKLIYNDMMKKYDLIIKVAPDI